jgi:hypothetical protein
VIDFARLREERGYRGHLLGLIALNGAQSRSTARMAHLRFASRLKGLRLIVTPLARQIVCLADQRPNQAGQLL